jgi:hypothetical protein
MEGGLTMLSPVNRPFMLSEIAMVFDVPVNRLQRLVERYRIDPALRIGRTRLYGPSQIRTIYSVLGR